MSDDYPESVRSLAEWLHGAYEDAAADAGWDTQEGTSVAFDELPAANRETMLQVADRLTASREDRVIATNNDAPPLYPFPNDEILFSKHNPDFDPAADSWFALGKLPESDVRTFNGHEHDNPYRLAIRTPVRGSWAMFANAADCATLLGLAMTGLAHDESGMYSPKDDVAFTFDPEYWEIVTGIEIDVTTADETGTADEDEAHD